MWEDREACSMVKKLHVRLIFRTLLVTIIYGNFCSLPPPEKILGAPLVVMDRKDERSVQDSVVQLNSSETICLLFSRTEGRCLPSVCSLAQRFYDGNRIK